MAKGNTLPSHLSKSSKEWRWPSSFRTKWQSVRKVQRNLVHLPPTEHLSLTQGKGYNQLQLWRPLMLLHPTHTKIQDTLMPSQKNQREVVPNTLFFGAVEPAPKIIVLTKTSNILALISTIQGNLLNDFYFLCEIYQTSGLNLRVLLSKIHSRRLIANTIIS